MDLITGVAIGIVALLFAPVIFGLVATLASAAFGLCMMVIELGMGAIFFLVEAVLGLFMLVVEICIFLPLSLLFKFFGGVGLPALAKVMDAIKRNERLGRVSRALHKESSLYFSRKRYIDHAQEEREKESKRAASSEYHEGGRT